MSEKVIFGKRPTVTKKLPISKGEVIMNTGLTVGETREIFTKYPNAGDQTSLDAQNASFEMLEKLIISWNFTDENGIDLPVSKEILDQLQSQDLEVLNQVIVEGYDKKK